MPLYEQYELVPLQARTATLSTPDQRAAGASGVMITVHVGTAGSSTLTLRISGKEPFEGNYYQMNADIALAAGRNVIVLAPGVAMQPDGEAADTTSVNVKQVVAVPLPDVWKVDFVKGDGSSWSYGAIAQRLA